jgi:hypothetical protein
MSGLSDFLPSPHTPGHPAPPEPLLGAWYLKLSGSASTEGFTRFWSWVIILQTMVPIALLVSSEVSLTRALSRTNTD